MNPTEHALTVVIEEAAEIQRAAEVGRSAAAVIQTATKALRFSLDDGYPGASTTNREDLVCEFNDLIGAMEYLAEKENLPGLFDREQIEAKKARIREWETHAEAMGALQR